MKTSDGVTRFLMISQTSLSGLFAIYLVLGHVPLRQSRTPAGRRGHLVEQAGPLVWIFISVLCVCQLIKGLTP